MPFEGRDAPGAENREVSLDELEQREGLTVEEKKFAVGVRETVIGWIREPIQISKFGDDYYQRIENNIKGWYRTYLRGQFRNPHYVENQYGYTLPTNEKELQKFFSSPYGMGPILPASLLSDEEAAFMRAHGIDNYDLVERMDSNRVRQMTSEIHSGHRREFETLSPQMMRFNTIAAKMNRAEDARKATELGIPVEDYRFIVDYEEAAVTFNTSVDPATTKDIGKMNELFYLLWERSMGLPANIITGGQREKGDAQLEALPDALVEEQLRQLIQGNADQLQILEQLKAEVDRYKELKQQYAPQYAERQIRKQVSRELELPQLVPVYKERRG